MIGQQADLQDDELSRGGGRHGEQRARCSPCSDKQLDAGVTGATASSEVEMDDATRVEGEFWDG